MVLLGFRKTIVDKTDSRPPNSGHDHFFGASLALERGLEHLLSLTTELDTDSHLIKPTLHRTSQSDGEMVNSCCVE